MHEAWYEFFSTSRMVYFLAGVVIATLWLTRKIRREEGIKIDLTPVGIIMGVSVLIFVSVQQIGLATSVKQCQSQTNTVLQERAKLSDQSDTLAGEMIDANSHWLATLTNPPAEIAALHTTDPIYRSWVQGTLKDYLFQLDKISNERTAALEARKEKTYPTPTCGL